MQALYPSDIPPEPESTFLVDIEISDFAEGDIGRQELCICAMRAAQIAGVRKQNRKISSNFDTPQQQKEVFVSS